MGDIYDKACDFLTRNPQQIQVAWDSPSDHPAGVLFRAASPLGESVQRPGDYLCCGCLIEIRQEDAVAWTKDLTEAIRADDRIPADYDEIQPEDLKVWAEWNRRIDQILKRDPAEYMESYGLVLQDVTA